jgi:hypothetical protein
MLNLSVDRRRLDAAVFILAFPTLRFGAKHYNVILFNVIG